MAWPGNGQVNHREDGSQRQECGCGGGGIGSRGEGEALGREGYWLLSTSTENRIKEMGWNSKRGAV